MIWHRITLNHSRLSNPGGKTKSAWITRVYEGFLKEGYPQIIHWSSLLPLQSGPPSDVWWLRTPMKTLVISIINQSYWSYLHQLTAIVWRPTLHFPKSYVYISLSICLSIYLSTTNRRIQPLTYSYLTIVNMGPTLYLRGLCSPRWPHVSPLFSHGRALRRGGAWRYVNQLCRWQWWHPSLDMFVGWYHVGPPKR